MSSQHFLVITKVGTVYENSQKSVIYNIASVCELRLHFKWTYSLKLPKNGPIWRFFENLKLAVKQSYYLDWSVLIGQKLVENAKIQNFKCDTLGDF